ncbi:MAG: phosphoribosylglycinamide formyltransferase [Planctomycetota bacterium]|nr:phosphoribosylglycinamide formyltransferase [Planctomycetota bacterium]MDA1141593.1 phosphoribosylglycinamide formyltransferase [Planctomycetota bacterium]
MPLKLGILLSGSGRTLENLYERIEAGSLDAEVALVIGSKESAYGLVRAQKRGTPTGVLNPKDFEDNSAFSGAVTEALKEHGVELVILAGFLFFYEVPGEFENKVVNIHPGLIPSFCGKGFYGHHVHEAVINYGVKVSGCTVHYADATAYDHGPVILQKTVPVYAEDTPDELAARVFDAEMEALPEAIQLIAEGRVRVKGRIVHISED